MKIMQLTGTKNCKVFVNHVELIASARKKGAHCTHTHTEMVRASTLVQIDASENRKPRQVLHEMATATTTTNKFNQNACTPKQKQKKRTVHETDERPETVLLSHSAIRVMMPMHLCAAFTSVSLLLLLVL